MKLFTALHYTCRTLLSIPRETCFPTQKLPDSRTHALSTFQLRRSLVGRVDIGQHAFLYKSSFGAVCALLRVFYCKREHPATHTTSPSIPVSLAMHCANSAFGACGCDRSHVLTGNPESPRRTNEIMALTHFVSQVTSTSCNYLAYKLDALVFISECWWQWNSSFFADTVVHWVRLLVSVSIEHGNVQWWIHMRVKQLEQRIQLIGEELCISYNFHTHVFALQVRCSLAPPPVLVRALGVLSCPSSFL